MTGILFSAALFLGLGYILGKLFKDLNPLLMLLGFFIIISLAPAFMEFDNDFYTICLVIGGLLNFERPVTVTVSFAKNTFESLNSARLNMNLSDDISRQKKQAEDDFYRQKKEVEDSPNARDIQVKYGSLDYNNITFKYDQDNPVIENLTLNIKAGEKLGLVGRSGAGKSTLVNLALRFHDLKSGSICIDQQDITQVKQESLRSKIGMVTQDTSLLHRSVRENILYGQPDASEADMIQAAKQAEAHNFILELRDLNGRTGYDAHVGERGVKLSGGQRQRIAIARVLLKDAPILILDEATSALDSEVEAAIQTSLYQLMEGKTVIAIAHRLSTIAAMDRLIVLDEGKIIEQGRHAELLQQKGLYAQLWTRQSGGFIGE